MSRFKRVIQVAVILVVVVVLLGGIKALQIRKMIAAGAQATANPPAEAVATTPVVWADWAPTLKAVGSLASVQGVMVAAELPGKVVSIAFKPGSKVNAGDLLLKQDTSSERAQLRAAEAQLALARTNLRRTGRLFASNVVAPAQLDDVRAKAAQAQADADGVRAAIRKKTLRAPFSGRLGIRLVNLGQVISSGTPVVSLQSIDPIYANFSLPQQQLAQLRTGLPVRLTTTGQPGDFTGTITTINPHVSTTTRNVEIQATVANPKERLRPGMFVETTVILPAHRKFLIIPEPAVLHAPYGDSVFVVEPTWQQQEHKHRQQAGGQPLHLVRQQFVRLGERRGDYVAVLGGLKQGQLVASSGVFKLRNGQAVVINNALSPRFKLAPKPSDS